MVGKLDLNSSIDLDVRFAYGKPLPREETMDVGHFHHISTKLDQNLDWSTSYLAWSDLMLSSKFKELVRENVPFCFTEKIYLMIDRCDGRWWKIFLVRCGLTVRPSPSLKIDSNLDQTTGLSWKIVSGGTEGLLVRGFVISVFVLFVYVVFSQ